jgi:activating signal cointegrator 1
LANSRWREFANWSFVEKARREKQMKALSLWQPWASLMAVGAKHIETRSWGTAYRGPVAIHAAKRFQGMERRLLLDRRFYRSLLLDYEDGDLKPTQAQLADALPLGAVIAVGNLHRCLSTSLYREAIPPESQDEYWFGNYSPHRFMWVFDEIWKLRRPVFTRGYQALWDLDEAVTDVVLTMLPEGVEEKLRGEEN